MSQDKLILATNGANAMSQDKLIPAANGANTMSQNKLIPAANGANKIIYPVALASHGDVVKDPILFMNTLRSFHFALASKFQVPVMGRKKLNLHVLYVEVTRRGGYDKVVSEKKWREVSSAFDLAPTATSASYALRRHYFTLLHRYELVYFFGMPGPAPTPNHIGPRSFQAKGNIHGKLDYGYAISIKIGNETLTGVIYHLDHPFNSAVASSTSNAIVPYAPPVHQPSPWARRKRKSADPSRPKANRSGYNFFFAEKHAMLKSRYPDRESWEFTKMIGDSWNSLPAEERVVYQTYALKDKERYQREMKEYKERLAMGQAVAV